MPARRMSEHRKALSQLKIGDRVRIVRKIASRANGWENSWPGHMDHYLGRPTIYKIRNLGSAGVYLDGDDSGLGWPATSLKKVDGADPIVKTLCSAKVKISLR